MTAKGIIDHLEVKAYRIPTEQPESDGTLEWDSTTLVVVHVKAGGERGIGYTYADESVATLVRGKLARTVRGRSALDITGCWSSMIAAVRNLGEPGLAMMGVAAIDNALWDLKAKLLKVPLIGLLGGAREKVPIYGSGGFTSYTTAQLQRQVSGWVEQGIPRVKIKIGTQPEADPERIAIAREAAGPRTRLFVDANGAYSRKQALAMAEAMTQYNVSWFEEPVVHDDLEGLRLLRDRAPAGMDISSGEYGFTLGYFYDVLQKGAVDVLQADATRCGITGFLKAATLCEAYHLPLSSHCAPALHIAPCCAAPPVRHLEYFHDHVRIERMLFEGVTEPVGGALKPDLTRPGLGLELREEAAHRYEV